MGNCSQGMDCVFVPAVTSLTGIQERSSLKRKEMWKTIQIKATGRCVLQLILDMKVQWSSTYLMLD
jgi:hypothetical protein